jgi:signal transduction histidine kinase
MHILMGHGNLVIHAKYPSKTIFSQVTMNTKWKVILSVMLLIAAICTVFVIIVQQQHDDKVSEIIEGKNESAVLLAETLLSELSLGYKRRIKSFTNPAVSVSRERMIQAFADRDREKLFQLSKLLYAQLKEENHYFSTIGWILPDNHTFLRLHYPEKFGDDISKIRPDIVSVNRDKRQVSGFDVGIASMQYRIVQPVFYHGKYLGAVQFGFKAGVVFDALQSKLNTIAGMTVVNEECATVKESKVPKLKCRTHTIRSRDVTMFEPIKDQLDWDSPTQRVVLNDRLHVILNILPITNYQNRKLGSFFVALDIAEELAQKRKLLGNVLIISAVLLILSFLILYFSYGSLVQKIIALNQSLEKNNLELENRVNERTAKLHESEKKLHRAQKMEAIGMMAGGVAHDLNNILSGIVSYPELMLLQLPQSSELRKPLEAIQDSGQRAATVVADLLTVARGAASTREPHDINILAQEYLDSPECKKLQSLYPGVICTHQIDAEYAIISCSPIHIKTTLMNLLTNAAEAVGDDGNIIVSTCNWQVDESEATDHDMEPGNYVVLSVQDNGPGISNRDLEHIFEPFYTKKVMGKSGTGLGLAIVWNTVQDHQGGIVVKSSKKGTRFQLYFPVSEEKIISPENNVSEMLNCHNKHILVVDDEPQLRDIASQILQSLGYTVDSVCSGKLAIEFVKDDPVDLIVLDMLMEPGMNGRQTYEEISKLYPDQKAIIASGYSENADVKAVLQLGACAFIKKPYSIKQLGRVVKEALNS